MQTSTPTFEEDAPVPRARFDFVPLLLIPLVALVGLALVRNPQTWITLTIAGVGMGFVIFLTASGLTLVFGLMGVMNFGHGVFITLGAFLGGYMFWPSVAPLVACWCRADNLALNLMSIAVAAAVGMASTAVIALMYERIVMRACYGRPMITQILLTVSMMFVLEQLMIVVLGGGTRLLMPTALQGSIVRGDVAIEKYRLLTLVLGVLIFIAITLVLNRTKIGSLIRASVEHRDVVEAMGYRVKHLFVAVFTVAAALAALGGLFWGMYQGVAGVTMGGRMLTPIFIVLIIGGLGSITGACVAAILVGLLTNYVGYVFPLWTAFSTLILLFIVGFWRPQGLYPVSSDRAAL
ncbi:branched-chain amino acid ABC transporter permease [soil metagenome]